MKICYLFNGRLPTEKAHGLQIVKMCEAFARLADVELVIPHRRNSILEDIFLYYGVRKSFAVRHIGALDLMGFMPERLANIIQTVTSIFMFWLYLPKADFYYARDYASLLLLSFFDRPYVAEIHDYRSTRPHWWLRRILHRAKLVVCNSEGTKSLITSYYLLVALPLVAPNAVDPAFFDIPETKQEARAKLDLPQDKIIIGYVGRLEVAGKDKGVPMLHEAFERMQLRARAELLLVTLVPYRQVPLYLRAIDIGVIPYPGAQHAATTSPIKLYEYMAARKTIVVADGPDPQELAKKLDEAVSHPVPYTGPVPTWNERAKIILECISNSNRIFPQV